ncbi:hypothetical protein GCM10009416_41340 [Craurococcus roseus]|uniref:ORC1/DEAH AAA+ ATPase domain-containing protein n=2 Tax=Craurococcus roseus TaxID=77585 RepID=A0ABP3QWS9_9PROT
MAAPERAATDPHPASARHSGHIRARQRLAEIFTPTQPLSRKNFYPQEGRCGEAFVGRNAERDRIIRALVEERAHVVIYGERGRGKTSLANLALAHADTAVFDVARYICSADSDFDAITRGLLQDLPRWSSGSRWFGTPPPAGPDPHDDATTPPPSRAVQLGDILAQVEFRRGSRLLFVVDEFDRVVDENTRTAMADMIKQCSDRGMPLSFMIIGVSDSVEQLLGRHPSIQRCVARIALPLLSHAEVELIVARGEEAGLDLPKPARSCIAQLARGVPYMAQLLALRAGQAALDDGRTRIRGDDLIAAVRAAAAEADPRIRTLYNTATGLERDAAALGVLRAAALGPQDEFGRFRVDICGSFLRVAGAQVDPAAWRRVIASGAIRAVRGGEPDLYTFGEAMMPHFVLQRAVLSRQTAGTTPSRGDAPM